MLEIHRRAMGLGRLFNRDKQEQPLTEQERLDLEWQRQAKLNAKLYARSLGMSKKEYISQLPKFGPQPEEYKGRLDTPVIVQAPVPGKLWLKKMLELNGLVSDLEIHIIRDWEPDRFRTPQNTYIAWTNVGRSTLGQAPDVVRASLAMDERGGTIYEGLSSHVRNAALTDFLKLLLPGSQYGSDAVPCIGNWNKSPRIRSRWTDISAFGEGSLIAGRSIVVGSPYKQAA